MAWNVARVHRSPIQRRVTLTNSDNWATPATDYQAADALARKTLGDASLVSRGYGLTGTATRVYVSQTY